MNRVKYPRTRHLPWSPGASSDDVRLVGTACFQGQEVVITEKMDGENTTLYSDYIHARSISGRPHPSRDWVKAMHGGMAHLIPEGFRVCGENLYARHSVAYEGLLSYFLAFSVWNRDVCLSWQETLEWLALLGLDHVPILYQGIYDEASLKGLKLNLNETEGYVVRLAGSFRYEDFGQSVAKWVRQGHVQTEEHWMHQEVVPNKLS